MNSARFVSFRRVAQTVGIALLALCSTRAGAAVGDTGDVVGKLVTGYQGWFACKGDGDPRNSWIHWGSSPGGLPPSPGYQTFELWPDVREYTTTFQTGYANLGNGQPAKLFSSYTDQTVNKHFEWMQTYGIDCAAMQKFGNGYAAIATKVMHAAETYKRKFYIMYDISGWTNFQTEIKTDWTNLMINSVHVTSSTAYAKQNGKLVVCMWGVGVANRPGDVTSWTEVINWFKNQNYYVIIGGPKDWRSQTANLPAFNAANMVMPWCTGSFAGGNDVTNADTYVPELTADFDYCNQHGIDFQVDVFPGFAWSNWKGGPQNYIPRMHGDFMWRQFYNVRKVGIPSVYVGMFDEYDEGTAIAKAAENKSMIPTNQYFLTLDADGVVCSSDFYLRLTGDGAKMVKGQIPLTAAHPTPHVVSTATTTGLPADGSVLPGKGAVVKVFDLAGRCVLSISERNGSAFDGEGELSRLLTSEKVPHGVYLMCSRSTDNAIRSQRMIIK